MWFYLHKNSDCEKVNPLTDFFYYFKGAKKKGNHDIFV